MVSVLASIPSPSANVWRIGIGNFHLALHVYGLMIALGVVAAVWLARRRWATWGNDPDLIIDLAYWGVPGGLIGARLYHVITDYNRLYVHNFTGIFKIWDGGLGIPGGIIGGVLAGVWCAKRRGASMVDLFDVVAPVMPLAQAIGRFGNYFNQELFGRPTSLPWGLEINILNRPVGYAMYPTFHPTFAYEALWNVALVGALLGIDRHRGTGRPLSRAMVMAFYALFAVGGGLDLLLVIQRQTDLSTALQVACFIAGAVMLPLIVFAASGVSTLGARRRGDLFILYLSGYFLGRLWVESLRIDTANLIAGLRLNEWTALIVGAGSLGALAWRGMRSAPRPIEVGSGSIVVAEPGDDPDSDTGNDVGVDTVSEPDSEPGDQDEAAGDDASTPLRDHEVSQEGSDEVADPMDRPTDS